MINALGINRTATRVAGGYGHTCAQLDNQEIKCWGDNGHGRLGIGSTARIGDEAGEMGLNLSSVDFGNNRTVRSFDFAYSANCAILDNYDVKCWGENTYGNLGQGHAGHLGDDVSEMGDNLLPLEF